MAVSLKPFAGAKKLPGQPVSGNGGMITGKLAPGVSSGSVKPQGGPSHGLPGQSQKASAQPTQAKGLPMPTPQPRTGGADVASKPVPMQAPQVPVPGKSAPAPHTVRTGSPGKTARDEKTSSSHSAAPSTRRDSHINHPVAMPQREEGHSGGGGQGRDREGNEEDTHHDQSRMQKEFEARMPPSAQLSHKTLNPKQSGLPMTATRTLGEESHPATPAQHASPHGRASAVLARSSIQSAFQSFLTKLAPAIFKPSPAEEQAQAKSVHDHAVKRQAIEKSAESRMVRSESIRSQAVMENKPINANPKFVAADEVSGPDHIVEPQAPSEAEKPATAPATQAMGSANASAASKTPASPRNPSVTRNASVTRSGAPSSKNGTSSVGGAASKRGASDMDLPSRLSIPLAA